jgi:uncharacterized membrane protein YgdD (TMEM256/DUF423 family)
MNIRLTFLSGALFGMLGVALGAFGAHALKPILTESGRTETFELAVRYQFYHSLALLLTGIMQHMFSSAWFRPASLAFVSGIVLFSGSLFALCFTGVTAFGMITPAGGIALIIGWVMLIAGSWKSIKTSTPS